MQENKGEVFAEHSLMYTTVLLSHRGCTVQDKTAVKTSSKHAESTSKGKLLQQKRR